LDRGANGGGVQKDKFNSMLWKYSEFPAQSQAAAKHNIIKEKMQAVESGSSHTEKTRMALEIL